MKRLLLLYILLTTLSHTSEEPLSNPNIEQELGTRPLIICFDPNRSEGDSGFYSSIYPQNQTTPNRAISEILLIALQSKSNMVITSRWLWDLIVHHLSRASTTSNTAAFTQECKNFQKEFDPSAWQVYTFRDAVTQQTNEPMLLFIPRTKQFEPYINKFETFSTNLKVLNYKNEPQKISDGELLLGITIANLQIVVNPLELPPLNVIKRDSRTIGIGTKPSDKLQNYLEKIVINRKNLMSAYDQYLNNWDIYLVGHGRSKEVIAGMSLENFGSFIDFLNAKIKTRSLFYDTCYAGGENLETPFLIDSTSQKKELNFTLISSTTFDLPTYGTSNEKQEDQRIDFRQYFLDINSYFTNNNPPLAEAVKKVSDWSRSYKSNRVVLEIPAVRFPHIGWFRILDVDTLLFRLNKSVIMRSINKEKYHINIPSTAQMILIETPFIPIPLILQGSIMPLLVPTELNTDYYFKEINAPNINLCAQKNPFFNTQDFTEMLSIVKTKMANIGIFYIESLIIKLDNQRTEKSRNLGWGSQPLEFKEVIIDPNNFISVLYNNNRFTLKASNNLWTDTPDLFMEFFPKKDIIHLKSNLPESMKANIPAPMFDKTLWQRYSLIKNDPEKLKRLRRMLSQGENEALDQLIKFQPQENQ